MEANNNTILIIEDDEGLSELLAERIEESGYNTVCMFNPVEALEWLTTNVPFMMTLDYGLPGMTGEEFIIELKKKKIHIPPFIVSTGQGDERVAVEMMKLGAKDYIIKDRNLLDMILLVIRKVAREVDNEHKLKLAEQALIESDKFNKQIIHSAQEGIIVYDIDLKYKVWNPFMEKLSGIPASEILGKHPLDVFPNIKNNGVIEIIEKALHGETILELDLPFNFQVSRKSGCTSDSTAPLYNYAGEIVGAITTVRDITERKQIQDKLKTNETTLKQLNADKDRFMSILAHDLKGPFNTILGYLDLLSENIHKYPIDRIEQQIGIVNNAAQKTYSLLEDILMWARSQSGKISFIPQKLNFSSICTDIVENLLLNASKKNIAINHSIAHNITVFADRDMIKTVLRNLISNAIKFTNKGGEINLRIEKFENLRMETIANVFPNSQIQESSNYQIISVSDNGIGMSPKMVEKLFDITQTNTTEGTEHESGTGLGLLLCKEFVEKHNGKIWVESVEGKGSEFKFTLPIKQ